MTSIADIDIPGLLRWSSRPSPVSRSRCFATTPLLADVGLDSLSLIQALLTVREDILEDLGVAVDDVEDPPALPWMETVGELIAFVRSSVPATLTGE